jgi:ABC-type nitrate/sulfonate/bicarbonate transport system permease component
MQTEVAERDLAGMPQAERGEPVLPPDAVTAPMAARWGLVPRVAIQEFARRWLLPALLLLSALAVWEAWVRAAGTPRWLLPPPSAIARSLYVDRVLLLEHGWVTLQAVVLGFGLALVAGLLLAAAIDASVVLERAIYPIVIASQTVPIVALAPLLLIWFGYGLPPKVLVAALIGFFPIAVNTVDGLRSVDREVIDLLRILGAGRWARFRLAKLPAALPFVFSGAKVAIAVCVIGAVFGELVGSSAGLGYLMTRSAAQFLTARVFACIVLLSLMGVGLFAIVAHAERLLVPWRRYTTGPGRTDRRLG